MENIQNNYFATCGDAFLFDKPVGIEIRPRNILEKTPSTKREFMEVIKQTLLKRFNKPEEKEKDSLCVVCRAHNTEKFLFPTCRMVHSFACEGCIPEILKDGGSACDYSGCKNDNLLKEEFGKTAEQHKIDWIRNDGILLQPPVIEFFTLAIPEHHAELVILHSETTVTLENIALSDILFSKLLEKTKLVVGENVSVFGNFEGEDCIREGMDLRELCLLRPASFPGIQDSIRFMENIAGIPNESIKLGKVKKLELWNYAINVIPKLRLHEEGMIERFYLNADKKECVSEIISANNNSILLGKVKNLELNGYSVNILPKLRLHEENVMDRFCLITKQEEHVYEIIHRKNNNIWLGKVKKLELSGYSVNILPKLVLHEENVMERFCLIARQEEHVPEILRAKNNKIRLGKVKKLELSLSAINTLHKLVLHEENEMEEFCLITRIEEYVSEVIKEENNSIWLGKVKKLELSGYSVNILPKLRLHEENVMKELVLNAPQTGHLSEIEKTENNSIHTRTLKNLKLWSYAINALPKLHGENEIEELVIADVDGKCCSNDVFSSDIDFCSWKIKMLRIDNSAIDFLRIRKGQDCVLDRFEFVPREEEKNLYLKTRHFSTRIDIGRVRQNGLFVPEEVRPILKYILVDEEGNEVAKKKKFFIL